MDEKSPSPPSSPPGDGEVASKVTKKRSHEDMSRSAEVIPSSSATLVGDINPFSSQLQPPTAESGQVASVQPSMLAHRAMGPPGVPASKTSTLNPSQSTPPSGQGSAAIITSRPEAGQTQKPANSGASAGARESHDKTVKETNSPSDIVSPDSPPLSDPDEKIEDFDWANLESRYHNKVEELNAKEAEVMHEFNSLCQYFGVWAQTGSNYEVDRSYKRLKTQMTLIQHHEEDLERKRQHYIQVVNAFKSALQLLTG